MQDFIARTIEEASRDGYVTKLAASVLRGPKKTYVREFSTFNRVTDPAADPEGVTSSEAQVAVAPAFDFDALYRLPIYQNPMFQFLS